MFETINTEIEEVQIEPVGGFDPSKVFNDYFVERSEVIEAQPMAVSMGTHDFMNKTVDTGVMSYGDFSCIVGASKSKKTFLKSLFEASYIGGQAQNASDGLIKSHRSSNKNVISFDTEQSKFHVKRVSNRVDRLVGSEYENYLSFALREASPKERFQFIEWVIMESKYSGNIGFVSIDGVADLVDNFNDLESCSKVTNALMKWSSMQKCHIVTVLHKNFGTNKPVGHIGSTVLKKAETVFMVENSEENVKVTPDYTRNYPFEPFEYNVDQFGLPFICKKF